MSWYFKCIVNFIVPARIFLRMQSGPFLLEFYCSSVSKTSFHIRFRGKEREYMLLTLESSHHKLLAAASYVPIHT